jgi:hypothetical protein
MDFADEIARAAGLFEQGKLAKSPRSGGFSRRARIPAAEAAPTELSRAGHM